MSPVPSHRPGAKNPSRAAKRRNQGEPWVMEQVSHHLPLHRQRSSSVKCIRRVGEEVTANRTRIRYLVRQADPGYGIGEKGKGRGGREKKKEEEERRRKRRKREEERGGREKKKEEEERRRKRRKREEERGGREKKKEEEERRRKRRKREEERGGREEK
ncbi:hypothetical protein AV530_006007 [Patagioenas fasciata monilis]|uniref:Uncharacterized protein n=1 Tax=Patagioenas fasciata monilis TaxID=372326 RepID=A0A1V4JNM1_PATFA|nr:hypothetical protein AV530_006007 [Patagioenas fasciata monilis]